MNNLHPSFDVEIYRECNQDLRTKSDIELISHYEKYGQFENRMFAKAWETSDRISMRWLRGDGLEIGPGKSPCRLYGSLTNCKYSDVDYEKRFGSKNVDYYFSVDQDTPLIVDNTKFDFVIARHVLEHANSFLKALENMIDITKENGMIYIVLPCIDFDFDKAWLPHHNFEHHIDEYHNKYIYSESHQNDFLRHFTRFTSTSPNDTNAVLFNDPIIINCIKEKSPIPESKRFFYHKHNYDFEGWINIILSSIHYLENAVKLADCSFGSERMDCHFVLQKRTP